MLHVTKFTAFKLLHKNQLTSILWFQKIFSPPPHTEDFSIWIPLPTPHPQGVPFQRVFPPSGISKIIPFGASIPLDIPCKQFYFTFNYASMETTFNCSCHLLSFDRYWTGFIGYIGGPVKVVQLGKVFSNTLRWIIYLLSLYRASTAIFCRWETFILVCG